MSEIFRVSCAQIFKRYIVTFIYSHSDIPPSRYLNRNPTNDIIKLSIKLDGTTEAQMQNSCL